MSLPEDQLEEVKSAKRILKTLGFQKSGIEVVFLTDLQKDED